MEKRGALFLYIGLKRKPAKQSRPKRIHFFNAFATSTAIFLYICHKPEPMLKKWIIAFIDLFYPPFRKIMSIQTFRYAACGGANTFLDIFVFFIAYNYILHKEVMHVGVFAFKPYIAAFIISFCVSFPAGFFLMRNVVFTESTLHGRVQLFRYFLLVVICIILNYVFLKLFVEKFNLYPTIAKIFTTAIVVSFSYLTQKHYTFKSEGNKVEA